MYSLFSTPPAGNSESTIMVDGTVSEAEFDNFTKSFLTIACKLNDKWQMTESVDGRRYLYKRVEKLAASSRLPGPKEESNDGEQLLEDDNATLSDVPHDSMKPEVVVYVYHIVYSPSYNVPVLYFNAYRQNGSLLSLQDIWNDIPEHYRDRLEFEKWTFITQQEHPILGRPYFQLHPCHTADLMSKVCLDRQKSNYLVSWLSAVGPVVGLELPLQYGQVETVGLTASE